MQSTILELGFNSDETITQYAYVVHGDADGDVKLPTAAGVGGGVGIAQKGVTGADKQVPVMVAGVSQFVGVQPISRGDKLIVATTAGALKTANPAPGEKVHVVAIAQSSLTTGETKGWCHLVQSVQVGEIYVAAAADPGVNNDGVDTASLGRTFAVGSLWMNATDGGLFACKDNSTGAAAWGEVTVTY